MSQSNPFHQSSWHYVEEEFRRLKEPGGMDGTKKTRLYKNSKTDAHRNSETVAAGTKPA